jgi:hypothetical protein
MDERSAIIVAQEIESGLEERSNSAAGTLATRKAVLR